MGGIYDFEEIKIVLYTLCLPSQGFTINDITNHTTIPNGRDFIYKVIQLIKNHSLNQILLNIVINDITNSIVNQTQIDRVIFFATSDNLFQNNFSIINP